MARVERLSVVEVAVLEVAPGSRFQSDPASWCRRRVPRSACGTFCHAPLVYKPCRVE